jgi:sensor c-di-GMP phosphodiesterase-like protein
MKFSNFLLIILFNVFLCSSLILCESDTLTFENRFYNDAEYRAYLQKECEMFTNENISLCEKFRKLKLESESQLNSQNSIQVKYTLTSKTKTKSRITATSYVSNFNNDTSTESASNAKNELFNFAMPINTCKSEDCEFCCLSTNRCGTKKQCANSKYYIKYVHGIFFTLCLILFATLIFKCYQVDSFPDQMSNEKIDNTDLSELISMFSIIRNNRKKLIT